MKQLLAALDVDTTAEALALAGQLRGSVAGFTIGNRLFTSAGPAVVGAIVARGVRVFLDLKFHDRPADRRGGGRSRHAAGSLDDERPRIGRDPSRCAPRSMKDDQNRRLSASEALATGADFLVVGRPMIADPDPRAAAARIAAGCRASIL